MISPCKKECKVDPVGAYCETCKRTLREISEWSSYTHSKRKQVIEELKSR